MLHKNKGRKLGRKRKVKRALMRSLSLNLIRDEKIKTTEAKAKELRPFIEKLVTKAKTNSISARRLVASKIGPLYLKKLFDKIGLKYKNRNGGYTRIVKLSPRKGDASKMAVIEFV